MTLSTFPVRITLSFDAQASWSILVRLIHGIISKINWAYLDGQETWLWSVGWILVDGQSRVASTVVFMGVGFIIYQFLNMKINKSLCLIGQRFARAKIRTCQDNNHSPQIFVSTLLLLEFSPTRMAATITNTKREGVWSRNRRRRGSVDGHLIPSAAAKNQNKHPNIPIILAIKRDETKNNHPTKKNYLQLK